MVSIKVRFQKAHDDGTSGIIYYLLSNGRCIARIVTGYRISCLDWDKRRAVVTGEDNRGLRIAIKADIDRLVRIVRLFDQSGKSYTCEDVVDEFYRYASEYSLCRYMRTLINGMKLKKRDRTAETYQSALNSFMAFRGNEDLLIDCMSAEIVEKYEAWLILRGLVPNTVSFYTRILRAVYNRAVEAGMADQCHPFRHVYTGVAKTVKRAIPLSMISKIRRLQLPVDSSIDYARDIFMLSFFMRGMSLIDMAFLRKCDLKNGYVVYRRRKTGQTMIIKWTVEMQRILNKYPGNQTQYLLPIITRKTVNERSLYRNVGYVINHHLKTIGNLVGSAVPLTLYCARHSWASAAKAKGVPLSVISEGMGHDSESTTRIYLASLDASEVDRANSLILRAL